MAQWDYDSCALRKVNAPKGLTPRRVKKELAIEG
jgi:hypothetical protein